MTVWTATPALGYLTVLCALMVAYRRSAPPLPLVLVALVAALAVRVAHVGPGALIACAVALAAAVPVTALVPKVISPYGALSVLGAAACLPLGHWWLLVVGWGLAAGFALVAMLRSDGTGKLVELSVTAMPMLGVGPEHLAGQRVLPHRPQVAAVGERGDLLAASPTRVYLAPWLLVTVLAAMVIAVR